MPRINLTPSDLMDCVRGLRVLARQAEADAQRQGSSSTRAIFEQSAKLHSALADDLEAALKAEQRKR